MSKDRGMNYGIGTFIKQLLRGLVQRGSVNVFILELGITNSTFFNIRKQGLITIFEIPIAENKTAIDTKKNQKKMSRNIARVVAQYIPDGLENVVHMNYLIQYFVAISLKETLKGKIIYTQHIFTKDQKLEENYFDTEYQTYNSVDYIVTVSRNGQSHLTGKGVKANKIEVIYNGIDPKLFKCYKYNGIKEKYGIPENEKIILYSGRIDPVKGLDYLCLAMELLLQKFPDCLLVVAGDGDYKLLERLTLNFPAKICCLGFIPFEDVMSLYHIADIGIIPSLEEPFGYVALEMLHCGLPMVASNVGGLKEILIHNENALLVDMKPDNTNRLNIAPDVQQMTEFMFVLLKNAALRQKFSKNAITRANSEFTIENMVNSYLKILES